MLNKNKLEEVGLEALALKVARGRSKIHYIDTNLGEAIKN